MNNRYFFRMVNYLAILFVIMSLSSSCNKNLLNKDPLDKISDADFWVDPNLVESFVNGLYSQIGQDWAESWLSSVTDETYLTWSRGCEPMTQGFINPSDLGRMDEAWYDNNFRSWRSLYRNINQCNVFLSHAEETVFPNNEDKDRLMGEVIFIRALAYFDLVSRWGGVPLITEDIQIGDIDTESQRGRNSYADCVEFIASECDKAASVLPAKYSGSDVGRATNIAALSLKARILLYAASPLMNRSGVDSLVGYTSPDPNRWVKAKDANKRVIDSAISNGYSLYTKYSDVKENYTNLFLDKDNPEVLFSKGNFGSPHPMQQIDQKNGPNGYDQWGGNTPIAALVDDFEMSDGSKFSWDDPVKSLNPYANRDSRMYAFVLSDGDQWKGRKVETHFDEVNENGQVVLKGGLDSKDGISSWNTSLTGYNMRKFLNEDYAVNSYNFVGKSAQNWIWFRLAEFYLNYAECEFMLGNEPEARQALNTIRNRAQMPDVQSSGEELWKDIIYERRVELCFEDERYFDIRRWMIADSVMNQPAMGIEIINKLDGTTSYKPVFVEDRKFSEKQYWLPIPKREIDKDPELKQNPDY